MKKLIISLLVTALYFNVSAQHNTARPGGKLPGSPKIELVQVAHGFIDPVNVAVPNDGSGRIFVVERPGTVRIVKDGTPVLALIQFGFLWQVADLDTRLRTGFTIDLGVETGHDAHQRRLARTVQAEDANFCAGKEGQGDVTNQVAFGRDHLRHAIHCVDVLSHSSNRLKSAGIIRYAATH